MRSDVRQLCYGGTVGPEYATESFTAFDPASDCTDTLLRIDQPVTRTLMVSLCMTVLDVFIRGVAQ